MRWNIWLIVILSAWLGLSPWVIGFSSLDLPTSNNLIVGVVIMLLALWEYTKKCD